MAEAGEVDVNQPIAELVQHLESVVDSALLKTVPFQTVRQLFHSTRCSVPIVVTGIPCCSTLYLFKQRFHSTGCSDPVVVAGIPCCSMLYLFKQRFHGTGCSDPVVVVVIPCCSVLYLSNSWASFCLFGSQTVEAYSSVGHTIVI